MQHDKTTWGKFCLHREQSLKFCGVSQMYLRSIKSCTSLLCDKSWMNQYRSQDTMWDLQTCRWTSKAFYCTLQWFNEDFIYKGFLNIHILFSQLLICPHIFVKLAAAVKEKKSLCFPASLRSAISSNYQKMLIN